MKTKKMSFKNIKDVLSREEMKKIMAGSGGGGACGTCTGHGGTTEDCATGPVTGVCFCSYTLKSC